MPHAAASSILIVLSLLLFTISCTLTKHDVIGKWKGPHRDTLIVNQDNTFLLISHRSGNSMQKNELDTLRETFGGKWTLSRKSVHLIFSDSMSDFSSSCKTLYYWWTRASKRTLIRPVDCKSPSNQFLSYNKIQ